MEHQFIKCLETNKELRSSFNQLALATFDLSFEEWYRSGYWSSKYRTYSYRLGDRIISNASVNVMQFELSGQTIDALQIGTVMTNEAFRGQGLASQLIGTIIKEWQSKSDLIYLYANDESASFYPNFGFERVYEYAYSCPVSSLKTSSVQLTKLDLSKAADLELLHQKYLQNNPFSAVRMIDNVELLMFYCGSIFSEAIYYIDGYDVVIIAQSEGKELHCFDIFGNASCSLEDILSCLPQVHSQVETLGLGFTPISDELFVKAPILDYDNLFVLKDSKIGNLFDESQLILPLLSHA